MLFRPQVERIHVRARRGAHPQESAFDLALLVLKTDVGIAPVCLPGVGSVGSALPRLASGSVGLVGSNPTREISCKMFCGYLAVAGPLLKALH